MTKYCSHVWFAETVYDGTHFYIYLIFFKLETQKNP